MAKYIDKFAVMAEIESYINSFCDRNGNLEDIETNGLTYETLYDLKNSIDTLEVKEADLNNCIQLTWEDIRELYIIFAEVDAEIEFCKCDIQTETIGYYQEVLKRFKAQKGE